MEDKAITTLRINAFEQSLRENEKSRMTIEKYLRDVRAYASFVGDGASDRESVLAYKEQLHEHYTVAAANSMLAAINAFFRFCGWLDLCVRQCKVQRQAFCPAEKELTKDEYCRLVRCATERKNERLALILQTVCGTGIRIGELSCITAAAVRQGRATVVCKGKTRTVFLVPALQKKLLRYIRRRHIHTGAVFVTATGKPIDRCNVWKEMKSLCSGAGVPSEKVFPHNLRHLFARAFYSMEKDIVKLADILGHSSINTTRIYIITTGEEHRRRMERMHLIL